MGKGRGGRGGRFGGEKVGDLKTPGFLEPRGWGNVECFGNISRVCWWFGVGKKEEQEGRKDSVFKAHRKI